MPLPAKRKTESKSPQNKSKTGMTKADDGKGSTKNKLNRPIAGLQKAQMQGGADKADEIGAIQTADSAPKAKRKPKKKAPPSAY